MYFQFALSNTTPFNFGQEKITTTGRPYMLPKLLFKSERKKLNGTLKVIRK